MDFIDQLKQFSKRVEALRETIQTEEATKTAIIMPFFSMLGYDVFNPQEFVPEFTADVGIKKGEKVDYAVISNGLPVILVECKSISEKLERHDSQLFRYFGTTTAKFAILTNGMEYRFYTDLENTNKMDEDPFLSINIVDIKDNQVPELKKFSKAVFDIEAIFSTASDLKYVQEFKRIFSSHLDNPSDDFIRLFLQQCYSGQKNQTVIEKFRPVLRKALNDFISEMMSDKIKAAFGSAPASTAPTPEKDAPPQDESSDGTKDDRQAPAIHTTEEELEAYFIVKNLLSDVVDMSDITYKDTASYFNVLYRGNARKWICRIRINSNGKVLIVPDENKKDITYPLDNIYDLKQHKELLAGILSRYL